MVSPQAATARRRVLVTSALPYSNGRPHVGHMAGAYIPADIYVRYLRLTGAEVRFVCGSDDHGVAIMLTADKEGKAPAEVAKYYGAKQNEDFRGMGMSFDIYSGTSQCDFHVKESQDFFLSIYNKGYFEKQSSRQFYDEARGVFLPDRYVKGTCGYCGTPDQNSDQCENCGKQLDVDNLKNPRSVMSGEAATIRETVHWFLDLSRFEGEVSKWLETATIREHTKSYVSGLLSTGLVKRAMTRDISWGIPVPLDDPDAKDKVLYVWFDAPIGYVSFTKELLARTSGNPEEYAKWWKSKDTEIFHFIGEDNTIFHCVIWIAMLASEGSFSLPKGVIVNQFLNMQQPGEDVQKISKSRGNAIWIADFLEQGGDPDSLRYYLTMTAPERSRSVYKSDDYVQRHNSELANALGNFVNRVLSFSIKHFGETFPAYLPEKVADADRAFAAAMKTSFDQITQSLEGFSFKAALEQAMEFCRECNRYIDARAPWQTKKTDPEVTKVTLAHAIHAIKFLGVVLAPFMPNVASRILGAFGTSTDAVSWQDAMTMPGAGASLRTPEILFKKIEVTPESA